MAAANTDYFTKVGNPGSATTLAAPGHTIGGTTFNVGSTANHPVDTGYIFAVDTVTITNGVAVRNPGSYTEWEGVVTSGTVIGSAVLRYGTDQNYPAGATTRVYIPVASSKENRLVDGLVVSLNQNGSLKTSAVTTSLTGATLPADTVATVSLTNGSVTGSKLSTSAISLGYAQIITTLSSITTAVDLTGLSVAVTVPAGGRDVLITGYFPGITSTVTSDRADISVKEGSTVLNSAFTSVGAQGCSATILARVPAPSPGSHTYKLNMGRTGTGLLSIYSDASLAQAFILVELI